MIIPPVKSSSICYLLRIAGGSLRLLMVQEIMTREPEMQRVTHRSNHLTSEAYTVPLEVLHVGSTFLYLSCLSFPL